MKILKVYTREEILNMALEMSPLRLEILLALYPITEKEANIIKEKYETSKIEDPFLKKELILQKVDYYQKKYTKRKGGIHE